MCYFGTWCKGDTKPNLSYVLPLTILLVPSYQKTFLTGFYILGMLAKHLDAKHEAIDRGQ